jgi:hypothetical protein
MDYRIEYLLQRFQIIPFNRATCPDDSEVLWQSVRRLASNLDAI